MKDKVSDVFIFLIIGLVVSVILAAISVITKEPMEKYLVFDATIFGFLVVKIAQLEQRLDGN